MKAPKTIRETIDRFVAEVQVGHAADTARTYLTALGAFMDYLRQARVDPSKRPIASVTVEHLLDYPIWLSGERWRGRPKTQAVATYLSAVQSWLRYLAREKLHPELAMESERIRDAYRAIKGRPARKLPRILQPQEMEKVFQALRERPTSKRYRLYVIWLRDVAFVEGLRATGARISEFLGGNVEDLHARHQALRIVGKGSRERLIFFDGRAWQAVKNYLNARRPLKQVSREKVTPLFARHNRGAGNRLLRLSPAGARMALRQYVRKAGLQGRVTAHRFRHSFATTVLEKTGDLAATQDLLGHASPATTRIYAKLSADRLRKIHEQVFPA